MPAGEAARTMPGESQSVVLLVRAWRQGRRVLGRVSLGTADNGVTIVVCGSAEELCTALRQLLESWADSPLDASWPPRLGPERGDG